MSGSGGAAEGCDVKALNLAACVVAFLIATGEIARFAGTARFIPMALDELLVALGLVWAAWRSRRDGAGWHLAAWGALCGLALVLLVETADHQMHGPVKQAGPFYLAALSLLLAVGVWALRRALQLVRGHSG
jgi:fucose 4-O-acetylase-like acetyltransferase